jgi:hypothetical protein
MRLHGTLQSSFTSWSASQQVAAAFRRALASTSGSVRSRHSRPCPRFQFWHCCTSPLLSGHPR